MDYFAMNFTATTDPDLIQKTLHNSYEEFAAPLLTLDQYIDRERYLGEQAFAKRLTCWVLLNEENDILSACETYKRPCMARIDGKLIQGDCMAIGSVVTPPRHRKKGYATRMLKLLKDQMHSMEGVISSTLYSDIGPTYYDRLGWKCFKSVSLIYEAKQYPVQLEPLELLDIEEFLEKDVEGLGQSLAENEFVVVPTMDALEWLAARSKFYASIKDPQSTPTIFGAKAGTDYFSWMFDFKESILIVTHYRGCHNENITKLLQYAAKIAHEWNLSSVEIWDPSVLLQNSAPCVGGRVSNRIESLSSLDLFGHSHIPISWKWNEKFAWV
jgi:GNAT superfamily N-acetyltransferase